jgi:cell division protein FtsB
MTVFQIIYRTSLIVIAIAILTALGMILVPVINNANELRSEKASLEEEIAKKEERIRQLKSYQDRFVNDPDFVEHTARELGLITPGETVYEFEDKR